MLNRIKARTLSLHIYICYGRLLELKSHINVHLTFCRRGLLSPRNTYPNGHFLSHLDP